MKTNSTSPPTHPQRMLWITKMLRSPHRCRMIFGCNFLLRMTFTFISFSGWPSHSFPSQDTYIHLHIHRICQLGNKHQMYSPKQCSKHNLFLTCARSPSYLNSQVNAAFSNRLNTSSTPLEGCASIGFSGMPKRENWLQQLSMKCVQRVFKL